MKKDFEIKLLMLTLHLKEEKNIKYSDFECDRSLIYIFNNYSEYRDYFSNNGANNINIDTIESCKIKTTKKGKVIAYKYLCDRVIKECKNIKVLMKR